MPDSHTANTAGSEELWAAPGRPVDAAAAEAALAAGFTVAVRSVDCRGAAAGAAAAAVSGALGLPVAANAYLSPPHYQVRDYSGCRRRPGAGGRRLPPVVCAAGQEPESGVHNGSARGSQHPAARPQGLAAHYDDHCVFVLQLSGRKRWHVARAPAQPPLPRLFAPRLAPEPGLPGAAEHVLSPGDVLYVPRGFAHEALAEGGAPSCHVTFAVEVQPPFEAAAPLHCAVRFAGARGEPQQAAPAAEALAHCAVRALADHTPSLRAALLVRSRERGSLASVFASQPRLLP